MSECPHCNGSGECQDEYHESALGSGGIVTDFVLGSDCPSGCDGNSYEAGDCPHCGGSGDIDDD